MNKMIILILVSPTNSIKVLQILHTVNVDIFACINFRGFMKMGNFACIKIRVFSTNGSLGFNDSNFQGVLQLLPRVLNKSKF